ncbi:hypothetical protein BDZ94DRAFT_1174250 [Collybia nuda]|uniref:HNH nuclease domain-containing protein n=1 Tax=Collybia nuda TaxID=64659 RepID=A0A9P6CEM2_9AGAR|nr:hypothetical protein BDZ94DRAFT_1174250 [Collybia nuda]
MPSLPLFSLPLSPAGPPSDYAWRPRACAASKRSTVTTFTTGIDERDVIGGRRRCIICGITTDFLLQHCHIIPRHEESTWNNLGVKGWGPTRMKFVALEPRNGILLCANHHLAFDAYCFFIRYIPNIKKYILINFSGEESFEAYNNKIIALDVNDYLSPLPSLFIIHEMRVRGLHPFSTPQVDIPENILWQDWITAGGFCNEATSTLKRDAPLGQEAPSQLQQFNTTVDTGGVPSSGLQLTSKDEVIAEIFAATRASPSWKACQIEGTSWAGTAEENTEKYISEIGVSDDEDGFEVRGVESGVRGGTRGEQLPELASGPDKSYCMKTHRLEEQEKHEK